MGAGAGAGEIKTGARAGQKWTHLTPVLVNQKAKIFCEQVHLNFNRMVFWTFSLTPTVTRRDIPCLSELCFEQCSHVATSSSSSSSTLPADLTHYLVPFTDVVAKFMEVLEVGEFTGKKNTVRFTVCTYFPGISVEPKSYSSFMFRNFLSEFFFFMGVGDSQAEN